MARCEARTGRSSQISAVPKYGVLSAILDPFDDHLAGVAHRIVERGRDLAME